MGPALSHGTLGYLERRLIPLCQHIGDEPSNRICPICGQLQMQSCSFGVKAFTKALAHRISASKRGLYPADAYERDANDFYETPPWVSEVLLDTMRLRDVVWEPCGGKGALAQVLAAAGYRVVASDLVAYDNAVFPVTPHVDAMQAPLPTGVRAIVTNPPYDKFLLPELVRHWLGILHPVGGQLCLLLRVLWGESKGGQVLTTRHPAYARQGEDAAANPMVRGHAARQGRVSGGGTRLVHLGLASRRDADAV